MPGVIIRVFLHSSSSCHCGTHLSAIVTDKHADKSFSIDYPRPTDGSKEANMYDQSHAENESLTFVTLEKPDASYEKIEADYDKFIAQQGCYNWSTNDCTHHVKYVIDAIFGKDTGQSKAYECARLIFCFCLACGLFINTSPGPWGVGIPRDEFRRAQRIALTHGALESARKSWDSTQASKQADEKSIISIEFDRTSSPPPRETFPDEKKKSQYSPGSGTLYPPLPGTPSPSEPDSDSKPVRKKTI